MGDLTMISRNRRQKRRGAYLALSLTALMVLSGCGVSEEIPALVAPVIKNESYRPVEYGNVSVRTIEMATVMPEEYCSFYPEAASVDEICVDLGQYVEEGTVLAKMNTDALTEKLTVYQENLADLNKVTEYKKKINEQKVNEQNYLRQDAEAAGDTQAVKDIDTRIAVLRENAGFEELLANHQADIINEAMTELSETIEASTLVAAHSGYVTYVKNMGASIEAGAYENIVIVSDYEDIHLELDIDVNNSEYNNMIAKDDCQIYILENGKRIELTPTNYTNEELIAMERADCYCKVSFEPGDASKNMRLGDKIPVYFTNKSRENVLRIGQDSIYTDGRQNFVYVKTETGKEKRDVTIGVQNDMYAEVTEGLEEGEWVYYASTAIMPESYDEYEVTAVDYSPSDGSIDLKAQKAYTRLYTYNYYDESDVIAVYATKGSEVSKGELMCTLQPKEGSARKLEMELSMEAMKEQQVKTVESYDAGIRDINSQIEAARAARDEVQTSESKDTDESEAAIATASDADEAAQTGVWTETETETTSATLVERLNCQKIILECEKEIAVINDAASYRALEREYNNLVKDKNSDGSINIYANQNGVVGQVYIYEGKELDGKTTALFQIYEADSEKLAFNTLNDYVGVGSTAVITTEDGETYEETVIGNAGEAGKSYLVHKGDKVYVTSCSAFEKAYVQSDKLPEDINLSTTQISYSSARLSNAIILPVSAVHMETKIYNTNIVYYYVWKLLDGRMVKQYIQIQDNLNTKTEICVLDGLEPGDKIAVEKVVE